MKICLILHKYGIPLEDPCCYPLGFMYVSSALKSEGCEVKVLNYNLWDYDFEEELSGQDLALFTGFEEFKKQIMRDSEICFNLGIKPIVGGALATFGGMKDFRGKVYAGEIESEILGHNNIDIFPLPDYEGFGIDEYHKRHNLRYMGVLTGRGCPWSCTFCAQTCEFRLRKLDNVFGEIDLYRQKYNIEMTVFNDNTLNINKPRWMKICEGMKGRGIWCAAIRCQPFDDDMARAAKESGCVYLVVGVESFNQEKLDRMNKKIRVHQIVRTLDLLHKYNINYHGNVLFGFENESIGDINEEWLSVDKNYKVFPAMVQPFVGTKDGMDRKITNDEYSKLNTEFIKYVHDNGKYCYPELEVI